MSEKHPPSRNLQRILASLHQRAEASPGETLATRLTNNLFVELKVGAGRVHLQISRTARFPSEREWRSILRHWPYPVDAPPRRAVLSHRYCLRASWPIPRLE